jgi:hypothetical protein
MPAIRIQTRTTILAVAAIAVVAACYCLDAHNDPILLSVMCGALVVGALVQSAICGISCIDFSAAFLKKVQSSILQAGVGSMRGRFRIRTIMFVIAVIAILIGFLRDSITEIRIPPCWVEIDGTDLRFVTDLVEEWRPDHARWSTSHNLYEIRVPLPKTVAIASALLALILYCRRNTRKRYRLLGAPMSDRASTVCSRDVERGPPRGGRESVGLTPRRCCVGPAPGLPGDSPSGQRVEGR